MASLLFSLLSLLPFLPFSLSSILQPSTHITISLTQHNPISPSSSSLPPSQKLRHLAIASLARARKHKIPKKNTPKKKSTPPRKRSSLSPSHPLSTFPAAAAPALYPESYGGYTLSLSFGTPPQTLRLLLDTASDAVWFPCTRNYICKNCSSRPIPSFIPKLSSTANVLGCANPKCRWYHNAPRQSRCKNCPGDSNNCSQICAPYVLLYASGSTGGVLLSETLDLPENLSVPKFVVGCSLFSSDQPAGVAGFGRGRASLPSQFGAQKFSFCLLSHRLDDSNRSAAVHLYRGDSGDGKTPNVSYTPLLDNAPANGGSSATAASFYYVSLREIAVAGEKVEIPYRFLAQPKNESGDGDGGGGTIVDSGTAFTYMASAVFEPVAAAMEKRVKNYARAKKVEAQTGLRPCFNVSGFETVSFPELSFRFKGGAKMKLPLANYFSLVGDAAAMCFTIVTGGDGDGDSDKRPSIVLGNFQMQKFYLEFDLRNKRFGFRQQQQCGE